MILLGLIAPPDLEAQSLTRRSPVIVAADAGDRLFTEPHIAASPTDPDHLVAAAMISPVAVDYGEGVRPGMRCASFLSLDGGRTWTRHDFELAECFDPWVSMTPDGRVIFTALARHETLEGRQLVVLVSSDGGRTWPPAPIGLGTGHDHPTSAAETGAVGRENRMFVLSSQDLRTGEGERRRALVLQTSHDGGETFEPPVRILMSNRFHNAETAAVLSDGTLAIGFTTGTWSASDKPRVGWIVRARTQGGDLSIPLFITDACGPPRFALSALAADTAGDDQDRLHFACNALGGGSVVVTSSTDRGEQWSEPASVHDEPPAEPNALRHVRGLAVNRNGVVGVVWADRWGTGEEDRCYQAWFSASLDGGRSFLPARSLTEGRVCMPLATHGALVRAHPTGGDYFGLAAAADGRFHVLWPEPGQESLLGLRTAAIDIR